jgi:hypothetical protein
VRAAKHDKGEAASFQIVDKAIEAIRKQVDGFEEIATCATTSVNAANKIISRADLMKQQITTRLAALGEQLDKLKGASAQDEV